MKARVATVTVSVALEDKRRSRHDPMFVKVMELEMSVVEATRRLAVAAGHERAFARTGRSDAKGEVWLHLKGREYRAEKLFFHPADAADVLNFYFAVPIQCARDALSEANVREVFAQSNRVSVEKRKKTEDERSAVRSEAPGLQQQAVRRRYE